MAKEYKLDIFAVLRAIDQRDGGWLARQPEEAQKEFNAFMTMRWAACVCTGDEAVHMLWLINRRLNGHVFNGVIKDHPELAFRLLASCGTGKLLTRQWLKGPTASYGNNKALDLLAQHEPRANNNELRMLLSLYSKEEFTALLEDCGIPKKDTKPYLEAFTKLAA